MRFDVPTEECGFDGGDCDCSSTCSYEQVDNGDCDDDCYS